MRHRLQKHDKDNVSLADEGGHHEGGVSQKNWPTTSPEAALEWEWRSRHGWRWFETCRCRGIRKVEIGDWDGWRAFRTMASSRNESNLDLSMDFKMEIEIVEIKENSYTRIATARRTKQTIKSEVEILE